MKIIIGIFLFLLLIIIGLVIVLKRSRPQDGGTKEIKKSLKRLQAIRKKNKKRLKEVMNEKTGSSIDDIANNINSST